MYDRSRVSRATGWVASVVLFLAATLLAAEAPAEEYSSSRKFVRGLAGITTGFLEIPGNVYQESRQTNVGVGATLGLAKGLGMFVSRELVGVYELLTAPFAEPDEFVPVIAPEYAWQYFGSDDGAITQDRSSFYTVLFENFSNLPNRCVFGNRNDILGHYLFRPHTMCLYEIFGQTQFASDCSKPPRRIFSGTDFRTAYQISLADQANEIAICVFDGQGTDMMFEHQINQFNNC